MGRVHDFIKDYAIAGLALTACSLHFARKLGLMGQSENDNTRTPFTGKVSQVCAGNATPVYGLACFSTPAIASLKRAVEIEKMEALRCYFSEMPEQDDEILGTSESDEDEFFSGEPGSKLTTMVFF